MLITLSSDNIYKKVVLYSSTGKEVNTIEILKLSYPRFILADDVLYERLSERYVEVAYYTYTTS